MCLSEHVYPSVLITSCKDGQIPNLFSYKYEQKDHTGYLKRGLKVGLVMVGPCPKQLVP